MSFKKLGYQQLSLICAAVDRYEKQNFLTCHKSCLRIIKRLTELDFVTYEKSDIHFFVTINYEKVRDHFNTFGVDIKVLQHIAFVPDKGYYYIKPHSEGKCNGGLIGPFFTRQDAQGSYLKSKKYLSQNLNLVV